MHKYQSRNGLTQWNYALHVKHKHILVFCHILVQIILSFLQYAHNAIFKRFCYIVAFFSSTFSANPILAPQFKKNLVRLLWTLNNAKILFLYTSYIYMWFSWELTIVWQVKPKWKTLFTQFCWKNRRIKLVDWIQSWWCGKSWSNEFTGVSTFSRRMELNSWGIFLNFTYFVFPLFYCFLCAKNKCKHYVRLQRDYFKSYISL